MKKGISIKTGLIICEIFICLFLCSCGNDKFTLPELTPDKLETLYQQEFDRYSDKLPGDVLFEFESLSYNGKIYTKGRGDEINIVTPADVPSTPWDRSLADYPLEKICDVYGEVFVKPVYGDLNADGRYSDVYAWYEDESKVEGECVQGTIWKFGEYDPENLIVLTSPEKDSMGNTVYRVNIFYHLNDISLETGKDLLDRILNPLNADQYGVKKQPETLRRLMGDNPEEIYFLGDVYKGTVVTEKEVKDPNKYAGITIHEQEPYDRSIHFRDYGDGIIGFATPEGNVVYIKTNFKSEGTPEVQGYERDKAEEIYAQVLENYKELNRVIYLGGLETEKEELSDEKGMIYFRVLDKKYQSIEDIEELMASVVTEGYIRNHMSWVLGGEHPLFKEVNGELCIAMMDAIGIGTPNRIFRVYQFDETFLKVQGYNEDDTYFVSLAKQEDKWLIDELGIVERTPENLITQENGNTQAEKKTTISGSFTVTVRDVIPDYTLSDDVPTVAVVTQFQSSPFTLYVGEEIGRELEIGKTYVFTIEPREVDYSKEVLKSLSLASLVWEIPGFKIVDFRLAEEHETGVDSLNLTIE